MFCVFMRTSSYSTNFFLSADVIWIPLHSVAITILPYIKIYSNICRNSQHHSQRAREHVCQSGGNFRNFQDNNKRHVWQISACAFLLWWMGGIFSSFRVSSFPRPFRMLPISSHWKPHPLFMRRMSGGSSSMDSHGRQNVKTLPCRQILETLIWKWMLHFTTI